MSMLNVERNTAGWHSGNGMRRRGVTEEGAAEAAGEDHSEVGALKREPAEVGGEDGRRGGLEGFFLEVRDVWR